MSPTNAPALEPPSEAGAGPAVPPNSTNPPRSVNPYDPPPSPGYLDSRKHVADGRLGRLSDRDPFGIHDVPEILSRVNEALEQFEDRLLELRAAREKSWRNYDRPVKELRVMERGGGMRFQPRW